MRAQRFQKTKRSRLARYVAITVAVAVFAISGVMSNSGDSAEAAPDDGQAIYLANNGAVTSGVLPSGSSTWSAQTLPSSAMGVVLNTTGTTAFYVSYSPGTVYRVDTATGAVTGTLAVSPNQPWVSGSPIALSPDGSTLFIAGYGSGSVGVVDVASFTALTPIALSGQIRGVAVSPDGSHLYATDKTNNLLYVVDLATRASTSTTLFNAYSIAVSPDGSRVAVSSDTPGSTGRPAVGIYNAAGVLLAATLQGSIGGGSGNGVSGLAFSPDGSVLYGITGQSQVVEINPATGDLLRPPVATGTTNVFGLGSHLVMSSDGARLYLNHAAGAARYDTAAHAMGPDLGTSGTQNVDIGIAADQAPTAAFSSIAAPAGQDSQFDASASSAPSGTIASYAWDFGDGSQSTTSDPVITHEYASAGNYTVTLTVTSSGGTSTQVVYTGRAVLRNGGPSAQTAHDVLIEAALTPVTPLPPTPTLASCAGNPTTTTIVVPDQPGVVFEADGEPIAPTDVVSITAADPIVTITASAASGFVLTDGAEDTWTYTFADPGCVTPPTPVTAVEPTVVEASCVGDPEATTVSIPVVNGVSYFAGGVEVAGTVTLDAARPEITITAVADPGFTLTAAAQWDYAYTAPECLTPVTAQAPTQVEATCAAPGSSTVTIPTVVGVEYVAEGAPVTGTVTLTPTTPAVSITTLALPGYELTSTDRWDFVYSAPTCPIPPVVTVQDPGNQSDPTTVPATLSILATDTTDEPLVYHADGLPPGLTIDPNSGVISGVPTQKGEFAVQVVVCLVADQTICGGTAFSWTITDQVIPPPPPPPSGGGGGGDRLPGTGADSTGPLHLALGLLLIGGALTVGVGLVRRFRPRNR